MGFVASTARTGEDESITNINREMDMSKHQALRELEAAERKAWRVKMNGSEADACTIYGKEGKNELAWQKAADACHDYRSQHGLLGMSWKQIEATR